MIGYCDSPRKRAFCGEDFKDTEKFLNTICKGNRPLFRCISHAGNINNAEGYFNEVLADKLYQLNEQGYEIYFVPNTGGYKDNQISQINTVFIDLDCGKNENNNYYALDVVKQYKYANIQKLLTFDCPPTSIIETRNGLHVYWLVGLDTTIEEFTDCENRLISFFNADKAVKNPARLLRVPGFYWNKDMNNRFLVKVIQSSEVEYDIHQILDSLPGVEEKNPTIKRNNNYYSLSLVQKTNFYLIQNREVSALQDILQPEPITLSSHEEVYDYLKKQDLAKFLGVTGNSFPCLFHNDHNPSAGIIINSETTHYIYHCFSSNCGFTGTIIQCTERILKYNRVEALRFLRKVYKIDYFQTEWEKEQIALLEENQRFLYSDEFPISYPALYSRVKRYLPQLYLLNGLAKKLVVCETFSDSQGNALFFASNRHLCRVLQKNDIKTVSQRVNLFAYLGLIRKVPIEEIPEFLLRRAKHEAASKKQKQLISFFSVPSYCYDLLSAGEIRAKTFKEKGYTMKAFGRELILRTEGEEEAKRVYPNVKGKEIPHLHQQVSLDIEYTTLDLIEEKGWTTEKEIIKHLMLDCKGKQTFSERQVKRVLPDILVRNKLRRIRCNNQIKEFFRITSRGYPYIIVPLSKEPLKGNSIQKQAA